MSLLGKENEDWYEAGRRSAEGLIRRFSNDTNVKISLAIGGLFVKGEDICDFDHWRFSNPKIKCSGGNPPDFVNSLDQMHAAEEWLLQNGDIWHRYCDTLLDLLVHSAGYQAAEMLIHASSQLRSQAFVKVIEKSASESSKLG